MPFRGKKEQGRPMIVKRKLDGEVDKLSANQEICINQTRLYVTYEKSGGQHLVELGLTTCRLVVRQACSPAIKISVRLEILKACCRSKYLTFHFV